MELTRRREEREADKIKSIESFINPDLYQSTYQQDRDFFEGLGHEPDEMEKEEANSAARMLVALMEEGEK